jgi:hypothetical protein
MLSKASSISQIAFQQITGTDWISTAYQYDPQKRGKVESNKKVIFSHV